jgi:hypothetical protein
MLSEKARKFIEHNITELNYTNWARLLGLPSPLAFQLVEAMAEGLLISGEVLQMQNLTEATVVNMLNKLAVSETGPLHFASWRFIMHTAGLWELTSDIKITTITTPKVTADIQFQGEFMGMSDRRDTNVKLSIDDYELYYKTTIRKPLNDIVFGAWDENIHEFYDVEYFNHTAMDTWDERCAAVAVSFIRETLQPSQKSFSLFIGTSLWASSLQLYNDHVTKVATLSDMFFVNDHTLKRALELSYLNIDLTILSNVFTQTTQLISDFEAKPADELTIKDVYIFLGRLIADVVVLKHINPNSPEFMDLKQKCDALHTILGTLFEYWVQGNQLVRTSTLPQLGA